MKTYRPLIMVAGTSCIQLEYMFVDMAICLVPTHLLFLPIYRDPFEYKCDMRNMNKCGGGGIAYMRNAHQFVSPHPLLILPLHTTNSLSGARLPGVAGLLQGHGMKWITSRNKFT